MALAIAALNEWLTSESIYRKRVLLEDHLELLTPQCEQYIQELIAAHNADRSTREVLSSHLRLLQDVRQRGGTAKAVREAYINIASISVLDLPLWLEQVMHELHGLGEPSMLRQTLHKRTILIANALQHVRRDNRIIQEVRAELQTLLGQLLQEAQTIDGCKLIEDAIVLYKDATQVYNRARYPLRYASLMNNLALAHVSMYGHLPMSERGAAIERAIAYMEEAAFLYSPEHFPDAWAQIQSNLGELYRLRLAGNEHERKKNLEEAIAHHQQALQVFTRKD